MTEEGKRYKWLNIIIIYNIHTYPFPTSIQGTSKLSLLQITLPRPMPCTRVFRFPHAPDEMLRSFSIQACVRRRPVRKAREHRHSTGRWRARCSGLRLFSRRRRNGGRAWMRLSIMCITCSRPCCGRRTRQRGYGEGLAEGLEDRWTRWNSSCEGTLP